MKRLAATILFDSRILRREQRHLWLLITITLLILFLVPAQLAAQQAGQRPRIGVTLSGGGAKGLAHLGILKAIDSAGLKVDYVTGTSMGAILGSLYAVGYSADSLIKIARAVDWDILLRNQADLRSLFMEEKEESSKYVVELPWINHQLKLSTGLLEAQELWIKFSELFFPVYKNKDFSQFSIPFRCISTDVGTGNAVVLKNGEIISAVRASMAIPSVFTAVDIDSLRLVDGGIVRNFPVKDVREMGADIVIGSNVASGLLPSEKVRNVFQILLQVAFFRESEDSRKEIPLCDVYVPFSLEEFSMGSFNNAEAILKKGLEEGERLYPRFKHLADSLNAIYGDQAADKNRLPKVDSVWISSFSVSGLEKTRQGFFINTMNFKTGNRYSARQLSNMLRQAFGTRYYNRITYSLHSKADGSAHIEFHVSENPFTFAKLGLHYSRFSGIGLIGNITTRNFFTPNSRSLVTFNLGESFRLKGEHLQYLGRLKNFALVAKTQFDRFDFFSYEEFKQTGVYKQNYWEVAERLQFTPSRNFAIGIGHRFEWLKYNPTISPDLAFRGRSQFNSFQFYLHHHTLDRNIFPNRGVQIEWEVGRILRQSLKVDFLADGQPLPNPDSIQVSKNAFNYTTLSAEGYLPFGPRLVGFLHAQSGINFNYDRQIMNEFVVGGMVRLFRRQVLFAGLQEGSIYTPAYASLQSGLRYTLYPNVYITGRANVLVNNFISRSSFFNGRDIYTGYALTFSYNFALGPLDLSLMYSDQTGKVQTFINLGIPF